MKKNIVYSENMPHTSPMHGHYSSSCLNTWFFPSGVGADGNVTVESIILFKTHEWFGRKPTVYFQCLEEQKVYLPDVVEKNAQYSFLGQESWQVRKYESQMCLSAFTDVHPYLLEDWVDEHSL